MNILVVGSGGREDAFVWRLSTEDSVKKIFVSPGHKGMERFPKVEMIGKHNTQDLIEFSQKEKISLAIIGPEAPLTEGLADELREVGIATFGPGKLAARLEGSKIFSKEFMKRHQIPTASFQVFENYQEAVAGLKAWPVENEGIVIKADGLAGGKGVVVTRERSHAEHALHDFMVNEDVSVKTEKILFEKILPGDEVSVFAMANGLNYFLVGSACDHKRIGENDTGPNTGGMGCFHDPAWPDASLKEKIVERILKPTLKGCMSEGMPFNGFLFMGLMVDESNDPFVVEYNVRFGDPETQTLLPLIDGELGKQILRYTPGYVPDEQEEQNLSLKDLSSVHVVATSAGYPSLSGEPLDLGHIIDIPEDLLTNKNENGLLFLAGVQEDPKKRGYLNTGGRVLGITSLGSSIEEARNKAYKELDRINYKGMYFRRDIAKVKRGAKDNGPK